MHWGCLRGEERPRSAGDCMSQAPARKTGSIGGISHRGDLMQGIGYRGVGRKRWGSKREKVGSWRGAEESRGNT